MAGRTRRSIEYAKKLKDPRWQRKRLEILQRDDFACKDCRDRASTLHVHHKYYRWGAEPWEYPELALVTLCEACHMYETERESERKETERRMIEVCRERGTDPQTIIAFLEAGNDLLDMWSQAQ